MLRLPRYWKLCEGQVPRSKTGPNLSAEGDLVQDVINHPRYWLVSEGTEWDHNALVKLQKCFVRLEGLFDFQIHQIYYQIYASYIMGRDSMCLSIFVEVLNCWDSIKKNAQTCWRKSWIWWTWYRFGRIPTQTNSKWAKKRFDSTKLPAASIDGRRSILGLVVSGSKLPNLGSNGLSNIENPWKSELPWKTHGLLYVALSCLKILNFKTQELHFDRRVNNHDHETQI